MEPSDHRVTHNIINTHAQIMISAKLWYETHHLEKPVTRDRSAART